MERCAPPAAPGACGGPCFCVDFAFFGVALHREAKAHKRGIMLVPRKDLNPCQVAHRTCQFLEHPLTSVELLVQSLDLLVLLPLWSPSRPKTCRDGDSSTYPKLGTCQALQCQTLVRLRSCISLQSLLTP